MLYCLMRILLETFMHLVDSALSLLHGQARNDLARPHCPFSTFPAWLVPVLSHEGFPSFTCVFILVDLTLI